MEVISLPHSEETEQELIAALLIEPAAIKTLDGLGPQHFYTRFHAEIFRAIAEINNQELAPNVELISKFLSRKISEISIFLDFVPAINPALSAKTIIDFWVRRELIKQANAISKRAQTETSAAQTIEYARREIARLSPMVGGQIKGVSASNIYDAARMIESYKEYLSNLKNNKFMTGIGPIDKLIRGVAGGEVLTIIARAGSFKTALLQNMLFNYARQASMGAAFFSIEMPVASLTERFFQILDGEIGTEIERMFLGGCSPGIFDASINQFKQDLRNVFVVPTKVSIDDVAEYVRLIEETHGVRVGVIGIDYLGLIDAAGDSEYYQISAVAKGLKMLAKALNLPVVVLSQVSRKGGDGEVEIGLDMGRGSGQIEEGADFVLGVWQLEKPEVIGHGYDLICRILKNRKGEKGRRFMLELDAPTLRFSGKAEEYITPKKKRRAEETA